jgi:hypothetical protein
MGRTQREYLVAGTTVDLIRPALMDWLTSHGFRILSDRTDGLVVPYDAPAQALLPRVGPISMGRFLVSGPQGSILGLNTTYATVAPNQPLAFALNPLAVRGDVELVCEFYFPMSEKGAGDLPLKNTIWGRGGWVRKQAYHLLVEFEQMVQSLGKVPLQG